MTRDRRVSRERVLVCIESQAERYGSSPRFSVMIGTCRPPWSTAGNSIVSVGGRDRRRLRCGRNRRGVRVGLHRRGGSDRPIPGVTRSGTEGWSWPAARTWRSWMMTIVYTRWRRCGDSGRGSGRTEPRSRSFACATRSAILSGPVELGNDQHADVRRSDGNRSGSGPRGYQGDFDFISETMRLRGDEPVFHPEVDRGVSAAATSRRSGRDWVEHDPSGGSRAGAREARAGGPTISAVTEARADPAGGVRARRSVRRRSRRAPGAARRHVPRERARRGQARRLGASRLELQRARHRRAPALRGAEHGRARLRPSRTATSSSRRRATTSPGSTRRSTRSASSRPSGCCGCGGSAGSTATRTSASPGSRRTRARSAWGSRRGAGSPGRSGASAAAGASS